MPRNHQLIFFIKPNFMKDIALDDYLKQQLKNHPLSYYLYATVLVHSDKAILNMRIES